MVEDFEGKLLKVKILVGLDMFYIDEKAPELEKSKKEHFHHMVARLLFIMKRCHPDLYITVLFLNT